MSETNKNQEEEIKFEGIRLTDVSAKEYVEPSNNFDLKLDEAKKEREYEDIVRAALQKQRAQGIRIGMLASAKAIMEYVNDTSKPLMKRIELIKKFCNVMMKDEQTFLNKDLYDVKKDDSKETNE